MVIGILGNLLGSVRPYFKNWRKNDFPVNLLYGDIEHSIRHEFAQKSELFYDLYYRFQTECTWYVYTTQSKTVTRPKLWPTSLARYSSLPFLNSWPNPLSKCVEEVAFYNFFFFIAFLMLKIFILPSPRKNSWLLLN